MKELTSRQQQALQTKQKIRNTSIDLIQRESYEKLTMNRIAAEAGISVGTLYHHYASKEELFFSGYQAFDDMVAELASSFTFSSSVCAIRSVVYAQAVGAFHRGVNYISSILSIQLSAYGQKFYNEDRAFPRYVLHLVEQAVADHELTAPSGCREVADSILRISRGCIFDCAVRKQANSIDSLLLHDLNRLLASYQVQPSLLSAPIDLCWHKAFVEWGAAH